MGRSIAISICNILRFHIIDGVSRGDLWNRQELPVLLAQG
jgi:hypothetical protein